MKNIRLKTNLIGYFKSMRWYYSFVSLSAGILGITFTQNSASISKKIATLSVLFFGWGMNQIINDFSGQKEDAINAPNRPLVSGELEKPFAFKLTFILAFAGLIVSYFLNNWALLFGVLFFLINIAYEKTKKFPLFGNIVFGLLIANCVYYASSCVSGKNAVETAQNPNLFIIWLIVWSLNFVLCFFADFKDYDGDKKTGEKTLVVILGPQKAKLVGPVVAILPFTILYFYRNIIGQLVNSIFVILISISAFIFLYAAFLCVKNPEGEKTYRQTGIAILAVVLLQSSLSAFVEPKTTILIFIANWISCRGIFKAYSDPRA